MEPKDMTRELSKQSDLSLMMRIRDLDIPMGAYWGNPIITELLRRLKEADALRKENAELRKDKARLDWLATNRVYFPIDHPEDGICVLVSENAAPSGSFGDMSTGDMAALRKVIDAARLAKKSEVSK